MSLHCAQNIRQKYEVHLYYCMKNCAQSPTNHTGRASWTSQNIRQKHEVHCTTAWRTVLNLQQIIQGEHLEHHRISGKSTRFIVLLHEELCSISNKSYRESILNIISHYQVRYKCVYNNLPIMSLFTWAILHCLIKNNHMNCHDDSACWRPEYSLNKLCLTSPAAIQAHEKALKATLIYRDAESSYCRVRNVFFSVK